MDLVIRGGMVIDGSGAPARRADVGVIGDRIVAVGTVEAAGRTELDAEGLVVTPGFVDIHTHFDGQATWDGELAPSSHHGVTSLAMGNCGVGFAPAHRAADTHDWLIGLLEGVEDIPGTALAEGLAWDWESFPDYLDALDRRAYTVDLGAHVPHAALRAYVMGERGADSAVAASVDEIDQMSRLTEEALRAGALGFTTSRTYVHRTRDKQNIGTFRVAGDEVVAIADALRRTGMGVMQLISDAYLLADEAFCASELVLLRTLAATTGRPLSFTVQQPDTVPDRWRELIEFAHRCREEGLDVRAQVAPRPIGLLLGLQGSVHPWIACRSFREIADRPLADLVVALAAPERRARILADFAELKTFLPGFTSWPFERLFPLGDPPDYEPRPETSIAALAARAGTSAAEYAYDLLLTDGGRTLLYCPLMNYAGGNLDNVREMLSSPDVVFGLSDAGAHCGVICDGSFPTTTLSYWGVRRTAGERLPIEQLVHGLTWRNARQVGWYDRGLVAAGTLADLNVIDLDALDCRAPHIVHDLPAGGRRLVQDAVGYRATIKRGTVTFRDGQPTGARPGRLVRGAQR
jgi:N-acyl-D-aspartate/D-glutamate deacylase